MNLQEAEVERTMKVVKGGKVSVVLSEAYYQDVKAGKYPGLEAWMCLRSWNLTKREM